MRLYQSNRLECLFARLVEICQSDPLPDPFAKEIIVVQHLGMRHWLSRQWAFKTGIAALLDFPLPARALGTLHRRLNPLAAQDKVWQREMLRWRILALLPEYAQNAEQGGIFAPLAAHLQKDADEAARFRLAGRIAGVFDQYQTYRPDLLAEWENTTTEKDWQAVLWRRLCADQPPHRARLDADLARLLSQPPGSLRGLPTRLHVFGIGSLAPTYLHILTLLGQHLEVHCYHLSACRRYWHNLAEARQQPQITNPLLVQLGQTERDLVRQFLAKGLDEPQDLYEAPEGESLLERLQDLLLDGKDAPPTPTERIPVSPEDRSLELHDCFSPLREVQALHAFLLDSFQRDPELRPGDILVSAPDMALYGPSVQAVFGEALPQHFIPFALPGQNRGDQSLARVFLDLLSCLNSRCTSTELLSLLEEPVLHRHFGLETAHLPVACALVRQAGICWGLVLVWSC